jgi:hypothetical protein
LVLLAVLIAGCDSGAVTAQPIPTAEPTPTLAPAQPLAWQAHAPPGGATGLGLDLHVAVAQSDGNTAYWCVGGPIDNPATVWATHDRAAHWSPTGKVPATGATAGCYAVVDDLDPRTVVAAYCASIQLTYCTGPADYISHDGGVSWAPVKGVLPFFEQLATNQGVTYAITQTPPHSACSECTEALAVSHDGMRTWTRIDGAITAARHFAARFWLEPASGALLVQTHTYTLQGDELWFTMDGGAHWTRTPNPVVDSYFVRPLLPGVPWVACGNHSGTSSEHPTYPSLLLCTTDGGRTWREVGGPYVNPGLMFPVAVALDGSVLAAWFVPASTPNTPGSYELRRLPPAGAGWGKTWEPLGPLPALGAVPYAASSGALWIYQPGADSGSAQGVLYTVMYV